MTIADNLAAIEARVAMACARAARARDSVTLVAVSKHHPAAAIREALSAGATDLGENYAQELAAKQAELAVAARWHFIGRLQRNKAKLVAGKVACVHAVDSLELAEELGKRGPGQSILLPVNLGGEASKGGVTEADAPTIARALAAVTGVSLDGLMTMPPPSDAPDANRPYFEGLRALRDRLQDDLGRPLPILSMGMSDDFELAIACGATHVRIGTAIFGARS